MALSFRDYVLISEAIAEVQLEEGKIDDLLAWVKKKLGPKATPDQIEAKLKTLKDVNAKDIAAVKKSAASRDFHARKAADAAKPRGTVGTVSHHSGVEDAKARLAATASNKMRASQARASERNWALGEEKLDEGKNKEAIKAAGDAAAKRAKLHGQSNGNQERARKQAEDECRAKLKKKLDEAQDFVVTYKLKTGDVAKRWKVTARDAAQAKRKFSDTHYGAKLVSVEPMKGGSKVPVKKVPEKPAMDEEFESFDD